MTILAVALAVVVGLSLGLLGGGGSILTVPLLVYVAGMETKEAIATSLLVVGVTSAAGAVSHARGGRVDWRTGLVFGGAGMAGAYAGGRLAAFVPATALLVGFALMMLATSVAMLRGRKGVDETRAHTRLPVARVLLDGAVVGLVTGIVGAGGGFLVVPALALLGGLPMHVAVGTSLVVIAMKSMSGLAGYLASVQIDWPLAAAVTAAAVLGSVIGGRLSARIDPSHLRKGFAWFVIVVGVGMLAREVPGGLTSALLVIGAAVVAVAVAWFVVRRRSAGQHEVHDTTEHRVG